MKSLLLVSLLLIPQIKNVEVQTVISDFYNGSELSSRDVFVIATDAATGEVFESDQNGVLSLPEGAYTVSGEGAFCFLVEQNVVVTEETKTLELQAGCE